MNKNRLEAFSDGVLAIIITIMVLEIKVPHGPNLENILPLFPIFISYILSFVYVAIYWNNHHHLMHTITKVNGSVLWANIHLLFWLSLLPFASGWMGENHFSRYPVILYGIILCMCGFAFYILILALKKVKNQYLDILLMIGDQNKSVYSAIINIFGVVLAFFSPMIAFCIYILIAAWWLVPNKKIEAALEVQVKSQDHQTTV